MTTDSPPYDIERVRAQFPSLDAGTAYFDSPGGTQTPASVGEAIRATLSRPLSNRGHVTGAERNASAIVASARAAMGDLLNVADDAVAGPRNYMRIVNSPSTISGFLLGQFSARFDEGRQRLADWTRDGAIRFAVDVQEGFDNVPATLLRLFHGQNLGKQLCRIG